MESNIFSFGRYYTNLHKDKINTILSLLEGERVINIKTLNFEVEVESESTKIKLLIDYDGSMKAFEDMSDMLSDVIEYKFDYFQKYYFYNIPQKHIFKNKSHTDYSETALWISALKEQDVVIIISDAGAAKDSNSGERFKATLRFLIQLKKHTQKILWINPLPQERWTNNSAEKIGKIVPMISLDSEIDVIKSIIENSKTV
jgi:uncharacterized protein with von Willebrand factor type A (vWA) domain